MWGGPVDRRDDLADLVDVERSGEATGCGAAGTDQTAADLPDGLGRDRVGVRVVRATCRMTVQAKSRVFIARPSAARSVR